MVYDGLLILAGVAYYNVEQVALSEVNGHEIYFGKEERPTIAEWRGYGHRTMFVLNELERLGAGDNPNLEPIMDMVQDITVPDTYGESIQSWRKCGLKAMFLLKELGRLGAGNTAKLKPILDMVNSITVPETSERDKEMAGLHSVYSNVS